MDNRKLYALIIAIIAVMLLAAVISVTWGLFGLVGLGCLAASFFILIMQKSNVKLGANPFTLLFIVAIVLIFLTQYGGLDTGEILNLGFIPGVAEFHGVI